ncbi:Excinuclease ABC, subunit A [Lactococcus cremoris subsp. cremoris UC509.9]|uniref:UvrABC system protein A n=1 Tax=Lactococcus lactis subsp. cremoris TaxID=1359 RepID=A0AAJ6MJQ2_LACLC|nr:excinuclease ABC subunit UvrA [Lactococcus cremoris]AFW92231.1 Excinuclease ABC, subunit A [Lactococcus cremoris subsp. cremoris UC509.9]ARD91969.1 excinuclease ABC subunit UvrA [Lactococcus cremoris]MRM69093.1 excinuclease ABC subunit UvrA [Lactococcus cremoris]QJD18631.1 excinuclease ABC subunit UvrA [Lactococcus cremoris]QRZ30498.1 Excinuclease ABC- subunit A [Lactococcus cremoris]
MPQDKIVIHGAREHNLKNIDVEIPRDKLVVVTGVSGSGKSSLAFETLYAEGQRRYVESLSAYARQFLGNMDKPDVDSIDGLSPAISIDQKTTSKNPRSTVGTVTEINDYLRLLYARVGTPYCVNGHGKISAQSVEEIVEQILELPEKTRLQILAPVVRTKKGTHVKMFERIQKDGYVRVRVDGEVYDISEVPELDKNKKHTIEIVIDRIIVKEGIRSRLFDSVEAALHQAEGYVIVDKMDGSELLFSEFYACPVCGFTVPELEPRLFSFNAPFGSCPDCDGLGVKLEPDVDLLIPDTSKTLREGAIIYWYGKASTYYPALLEQAMEQFGIDLDTPWEKLSEKEQQIVLYGNGDKLFHFLHEGDFGLRDQDMTFVGVIPNLWRRYRSGMSESAREMAGSYMTELTCTTCHGYRLNDQALSVKVGEKNIAEFSILSIGDTLDYVKSLVLSENNEMIAKPILKEIKDRLAFLKNVGLDYLTLSRSSGTLSGGESQRIRLATQIGSNLSGVLYILDEPSIGLHQRDNDRLIASLQKMRDLGNTLIVVEHDEDTMMAADWLIDVGPGAGDLGGEIIASGTPKQVMKNKKSLTGQYLSGKRAIPVPVKRRAIDKKKMVKITGASENNLKNLDAEFPMGVMTAVTGVSGSGKSTLVNSILKKSLAQKLNHNSEKPGKHKKITGYEGIERLIDIDQSPIGRTPRSNPATYTSVFDDIRDLFANTNEAKIRGYKKGRFSFNVKGGRCEACSGDGIIKIEMHFLPDVYVPCEVCHGRRYNSETLEVHYKGKNISEVLDMRVSDGLEFFRHIPKIERKLQTIVDVGLGYVTLGQPATTLSGGEAQRMKLASELQKRSNGKAFYILDEPTTGLHSEDIATLIQVLDRLVEQGNTIVVIEHNLDVIKTADYIIDLGPEGGAGGGIILAKGTPEEVAKVTDSYTGQYLKAKLEKAKG